MDKIKTDKLSLRKFGFLMAAGFALASLFIFVKHKYFVTSTVGIAASFMLGAIFLPVLLKYPYIFWMKLAHILSWVNTRLLLGIIFYLVFSPVGLLLRLFRIDLLARNSGPSMDSYWKSKTENKTLADDYRRQS